MRFLTITLCLLIFGMNHLYAQQTVFEVDLTREVNPKASSSPAYFEDEGQYLFFATLGNNGTNCCDSVTSDFASNQYLVRFDSLTSEMLTIPNSKNWGSWSFKRFSILNDKIVSVRQNGLFSSNLEGLQEQKIADYSIYDDSRIIMFSTEQFVYFAYADINESNGLSIIRTDGTAAGTQQLEICTDGCSEIFKGLKQIEGKWYFKSSDADGFGKLWTIDSQGFPKAMTPENIFIQDLSLGFSIFGDEFYFIGLPNDGNPRVRKVSSTGSVETLELKSDAGAILEPTIVQSLPNALIVADSFLYLYPNHNSSVNALKINIVPEQVFKLGDVIYFTGRSATSTQLALWRTNGSVEGTYQVTSKLSGDIKIITAKEGKLFVHKNGFEPFLSSIWVSDGTDAGTYALTGVQFSEEVIDKEGLVFFNQGLYFAGESEQMGRELWRTDSTQRGTHMIKNLAYALPRFQDGPMLVNNNTLYSVLRHSTYESSNYIESSEWWAFDVNTLDKRNLNLAVMEKNIVTDAISSELGIYWWQYSASGNSDNTLYFMNYINEEVQQVTESMDIGQCYADYATNVTQVVIGQTLFFMGFDGEVCQLWGSSNGESAQPLTSFTIDQFLNRSAIQNLYQDDNYVYFKFDSVTENSGLRSSIWRSDGTLEGTKELVNIDSPELSDPPYIESLGVSNGNIVFSSYTNNVEVKYQLWKYSDNELRLLQSENKSIWVRDSFNNGMLIDTAESSWYLEDGSNTPIVFFSHYLGDYYDNEIKSIFELGEMDAFIFAAKDNIGLYKLWLSDATLAGTNSLFEMPYTELNIIGMIDDDLYYAISVMQDNSEVIQVWRYSLSQATKTLVYTRIASNGLFNFTGIISGDKVFFGEPANNTLYVDKSLGGPLVTAHLGLGDVDNDGVNDDLDAFPLHPMEQNDADNDGVGDNSDLDNDNDGVEDGDDLYPFNGAEWADSDGDGVGDVMDLDDDNDGVSDWKDAYPYDATKSINSRPTSSQPTTGNTGTTTGSAASGGGGSFDLFIAVLLLFIFLSREKLLYASRMKNHKTQS